MKIPGTGLRIERINFKPYPREKLDFSIDKVLYKDLSETELHHRICTECFI